MELCCWASRSCVTSFPLNSPSKATPTQLGLPLKIADRSRVFNGIVDPVRNAEQAQSPIRRAHPRDSVLFTFRSFGGEVVSQSQILIRLIVSGVAVLNESSHALEERSTNIAWTALRVWE